MPGALTLERLLRLLRAATDGDRVAVELLGVAGVGVPPFPPVASPLPPVALLSPW